MILVTGASEAKLASALASGADVVCVDLEDTVEDKPAARRMLQATLARERRGCIGARLNPVESVEGLTDLLLIAELPVRPDLVVLTMVTNVHEVQLVAKLLPGVPIMVIVETAEGLEIAGQLAQAHPAVCSLWLGGKDLSMALGCDRATGLGWARGRVAAAGAIRQLRVFDDIYRPFEDLAGLAKACREGRAQGLGAKVTLDPGQVATINEALA